jgi:hypothetical protein
VIRRVGERGQLAVGLAAAFATLIAFLGLILRSGVVARDKMKLQATSDVAALAAADFQRRALNKIRELNEQIEFEYNTIQNLLLTARAAPCVTDILWFTSEYLSVEARTAPFKFETEKGLIGPPNPHAKCQGGCGGYDAHMRNLLIDIYRVRHAILSLQILALVTKANEVANDAALEVFLNPVNLPHTLRREANRRFGTALGAQSLVDAYKRGQLPEIELIENNALLGENGPFLFKPKIEPRAFKFPKNRYVWLPPVSAASSGRCQFMGPSGMSLAVTTAKITKDSDYETAFATGAIYTPPDPEETRPFGLNLRDSAAGTAGYGEKLRDAGGRLMSLFRKKGPGADPRADFKMAVLSLAKPYGGTFPEAGSFANEADRGTVGEEFQGARLAGLADKKAIGGVPIPLLNQAIEIPDAEGKPQQTTAIYQEDYLH